MAYCMHTIGILYQEQQKHEIAEWYFEQSLKIYETNHL